MKPIGRGILFGIGSVLAIALLVSLVVSFILRFTALEEHSISLMVTILSFFALFFGGFMSGSKGQKKGWMLGGLTGFIYTAIIFLYQFLGHDSLFIVHQTIYHICYTLTAMMGGVLGVNLTAGPNQREG